MSTAALLAADFATAPYDHQFKEFEAHCDAPARAKSWHMRTGKTKAAIDKACHLYLNGGANGKIDGVLIFAPNGVHANWVVREFPLHQWPGVRVDGLAWVSRVSGTKAGNKLGKTKRAEWDAERALWWQGLALIKDNRNLMVLAINTESMTRPDVRKAVKHFLKHRRVFVIYDESDDWGTPGSKRTKMARALSRRCAYRELDSGTIATSNPLACFSQFELLEKAALGFERYDEFEKRYAEFEDMTTRAGRKYPKLSGFINLDELRERIARFTSVVLRTDCHDMPDLVPEDRRIDPTEEQLAVYRELHRSFLIDIDADEVNVGERAPRFTKLQQVFSGFVIDEARQRVILPGENPRLDALSEEVYLAPGKVVVVCNFQADMDFARERLLVEGHEPVEYHGRVPDKAKANSLATFLNRRECKALIGHPRSMARGFDLSVASTIILYSHTDHAPEAPVVALDRGRPAGRGEGSLGLGPSVLPEGPGLDQVVDRETSHVHGLVPRPAGHQPGPG
jgi:hypothetical protein